METSTMKYPFGRCIVCGKEFNSELRNEYEIAYCPWCGEFIDDFMSPQAKERSNDIYCDECGQRIYERSADCKGGTWLRENDQKSPGVCSGPCERELCGNCGDWDVNGECEQCRNSPCGQCSNHKAIEVCLECDHLLERKKWADWEEKEGKDA